MDAVRGEKAEDGANADAVDNDAAVRRWKKRMIVVVVVYVCVLNRS